MNLTDCEHFSHCNAPVCPLDKDWQKRQHLTGDKVCFYLTESQKAGAKAVFIIAGKENIYKKVSQVAEDIKKSSCAINFTLNRAKLSGSKMAREFPIKNWEPKNGS